MCGFLMLAIGFGVGVFALMQHLKGKRILAAPFKKTGEILKGGAAAADPKGMVSTEGAVIPGQTLLSPCSQTPCLYYEVKITREWEKQERTENGYKTRSGSDTVQSMNHGSTFQLDDGTGPLPVDLSQGADVEMKKSFDHAVSIGAFVPGELVFGQLRMQTPLLSGGDRTKAFKAVEKIVPAEGKLFALGKLDGGRLVKPGWRSMLLSNKGRDGLLASTAKKKKIGFIGGGVSAALAIPLFIWGPTVDESQSSSCRSQLVAVQASGKGASCDDRMHGEDGKQYGWKIDAAGNYTVKVQRPSVKFPLSPSIEIRKAGPNGAAGDLVAESGFPEGDAALTAKLEPGDYQLVVRDAFRRTMEGGFGFSMELSSDVVAAPAEAPAVAAGEGDPRAPLSALEARLSGAQEWGNNADAKELALELREIFDPLDEQDDVLERISVAVNIDEQKPRRVVVLIAYPELKELEKTERKMLLSIVQETVPDFLEPTDQVAVGFRGAVFYGVVAHGTVGGKWTVDTSKVAGDEPLIKALTPPAKPAAVASKAAKPAKAVKAAKAPAPAPVAAKSKPAAPKKVASNGAVASDVQPVAPKKVAAKKVAAPKVETEAAPAPAAAAPVRSTKGVD